MTETDELRRMLNERGVGWGNVRNDGSESDYLTEWQFEGNQGKAVAIEWAVGSGLFVEADRHHLTAEQAIAATFGPVITGDTSDGYHTFNELYHHRAVLFSVIVRDHANLAWKSKAHHDGTMYDGMFIVGIETPQGQATYHYDVDPYWDMFECKEFDRAPEWDGHTPDESIARIATLGDVDVTSGRHGGTGMCHNSAPSYLDFLCSECGFVHYHSDANDMGDGNEWCFCPNCGAEVVDE